MDFVNPKVSPGTDPVDDWYRYYAGYSAAFVEHALAQVAPNATSILDPWNGTGTTTVVAANHQVGAVGFDINPAMVVVSRARMLSMGVWASIAPLVDDVVLHARPVGIENDPLRFWFTDRAAANIRGLQASVHRLLVDSAASTRPPLGSVSGMSTLAAFFYTALFRTVRVLIAPAAGTNPTWWKRLSDQDRLSPRKQAIVRCFRNSALELKNGLHRTDSDTPVETIVNVGNSRELPIADGSVDAVISSPPYCTRIDYGVSTLPELAILGADDTEVKTLRDAMVGTPTVTGEDNTGETWGPKATKYLSDVAKHESKASSSYYSKYFRQYYSGMWASLKELRRVTRPSGAVLLVVQDNYYKEIHNDTPGILMEMARKQGFTETTRHDFPVARNKANMNPRTRQYRSRATAVESVIALK
ncbi:MAG: class I SAM-dependent methyltransferase [Candidatus Thiodiazotropha taylori]|nr:class I SAM-dependent methyltransferase [Candidatus Thiodiazotropha endolucinida]MCW4230208.1 class I SAM-dependent methyltransferase [Candidatus Thiodiazotropha taylori]